ncbi:MAG: hypothetical protein KAG14_00105, partial [Mycoplasmataceae bacterium]|nr:hypothetical protein [Mycoplasmataceae bacterium]
WYTQLLGDLKVSIAGKIITFEKPSKVSVEFKIDGDHLTALDPNALKTELINNKLGSNAGINDIYKTVPSTLSVNSLPPTVMIHFKGHDLTLKIVWTAALGIDSAHWTTKNNSDSNNDGMSGDILGFAPQLTQSALDAAVAKMTLDKTMSSYKAIDSIIKDVNHKVLGTTPDDILAKLILAHATFTPFGIKVVVRATYEKITFIKEIDGFRSIQVDADAAIKPLLHKDKAIISNLFPSTVIVLGIKVNIVWSFSGKTATWKSTNIPDIGATISGFKAQVSSATLQSAVDALGITSDGRIAEVVKSKFDSDEIRSKISSVSILATKNIVFIKQTTANHLLIGTKSNGIFQATLDNNGEITGIPTVISGFNKDLTGGSVMLIDDTHAIIQTSSKLFKVTLSNGVITGAPTPVTVAAAIGTVTAVFKESSSTMLIGNSNGDIFLGTLDKTGDIKSVKKLGNLTHKITTIFKPSANVVIIGIEGSAALAFEVDDLGEIISSKSTPSIEMSSIEMSSIGMPSTEIEDILQTSPTHLLIAFKSNGVYDVTLDSDGKLTSSSKVLGTSGDIVHLFRPSTNYVVAIPAHATPHKITIGSSGEATTVAKFKFGFNDNPQSFIKTSATHIFIGTATGLMSIAWERDILESVATSAHPDPTTIVFTKDSATASITGFIKPLEAAEFEAALASAGLELSKSNTIFENTFPHSFKYKGIDYEIVWTFNQANHAATAHVTSVSGGFDKTISFAENSKTSTLEKFSTSKIHNLVKPVISPSTNLPTQLPSEAKKTALKAITASINPYSLMSGVWNMKAEVNDNIESWVSLGGNNFAVVMSGKIITFHISNTAEIESIKELVTGLAPGMNSNIQYDSTNKFIYFVKSDGIYVADTTKTLTSRPILLKTFSTNPTNIQLLGQGRLMVTSLNTGVVSVYNLRNEKIFATISANDNDKIEFTSKLSMNGFEVADSIRTIDGFKTNIFLLSKTGRAIKVTFDATNDEITTTEVFNENTASTKNRNKVFVFKNGNKYLVGFIIKKADGVLMKTTDLAGENMGKNIDSVNKHLTDFEGAHLLPGNVLVGFNPTNKKIYSIDLNSPSSEPKVLQILKTSEQVVVMDNGYIYQKGKGTNELLSPAHATDMTIVYKPDNIDGKLGWVVSLPKGYDYTVDKNSHDSDRISGYKTTTDTITSALLVAEIKKQYESTVPSASLKFIDDSKLTKTILFRGLTFNVIYSISNIDGSFSFRATFGIHSWTGIVSGYKKLDEGELKTHLEKELNFDKTISLYENSFPSSVIIDGVKLDLIWTFDTTTHKASVMIHIGGFKIIGPVEYTFSDKITETIKDAELAELKAKQEAKINAQIAKLPSQIQGHELSSFELAGTVEGPVMNIELQTTAGVIDSSWTLDSNAKFTPLSYNSKLFLVSDHQHIKIMEAVAAKGDKTFAFAFKERLSLDLSVHNKGTATYKLLSSDALLVKDGEKYKIINIGSVLTGAANAAPVKEIESGTASIGRLTTSLFDQSVEIQDIKQVSDNVFIVVTKNGASAKISKLVLNTAHDNIVAFKEITGNPTKPGAARTDLGFTSIAQVLVAKTTNGVNVLILGKSGVNNVSKTFDITKDAFKDIIDVKDAKLNTLAIGSGFAYEVAKDTYLIPEEGSGLAKATFNDKGEWEIENQNAFVHASVDGGKVLSLGPEGLLFIGPNGKKIPATLDSNHSIDSISISVSGSALAGTTSLSVFYNPLNARQIFISNGPKITIQGINKFSITTESVFTTHDITGMTDYINTLHISGETKVKKGTLATKAAILANWVTKQMVLDTLNIKANHTITASSVNTRTSIEITGPDNKETITVNLTWTVENQKGKLSFVADIKDRLPTATITGEYTGYKGLSITNANINDAIKALYGIDLTKAPTVKTIQIISSLPRTISVDITDYRSILVYLDWSVITKTNGDQIVKYIATIPGYDKFEFETPSAISTDIKPIITKSFVTEIVSRLNSVTDHSGLLPSEIASVVDLPLVAPLGVDNTELNFAGANPTILQIDAIHQLVVTSTHYYISTTDISTKTTKYDTGRPLSNPGVQPQIIKVGVHEYIVKTNTGLSKITYDPTGKTAINTVKRLSTTGPTIDWNHSSIVQLTPEKYVVLSPSGMYLAAISNGANEKLVIGTKILDGSFGHSTSIVYSSGAKQILVVANANGINSYEIINSATTISLGTAHSILTGDWSDSHITALSNHKYAVYTKDKLQIISSEDALTDDTKFMKVLGTGNITITSTKLSLGMQIGEFFVVPTSSGLKLINIEKLTFSTFTAKEITGDRDISGGKLFHTSIIPTGTNEYRILFAHGTTIKSVVFNPINFVERIAIHGEGSGEPHITYTDKNLVGQKTWTVSGAWIKTPYTGTISGYEIAANKLIKANIEAFLVALTTGNSPAITVRPDSIANDVKNLYSDATIGAQQIKISYLDLLKKSIEVPVSFTWSVDEVNGIVKWTATVA